MRTNYGRKARSNKPKVNLLDLHKTPEELELQRLRVENGRMRYALKEIAQYKNLTPGQIAQATLDDLEQ